MQILDTAIISYASKGIYPLSAGQSITSVTAKEFLLMQGTKRTRANYYVPLLSVLNPKHSGALLLRKKDHAFSRHSTDEIVLDFGGEYAPIIEYGDLAITQVINSGSREVLRAAVSILPKEQRKTVLNRYNFLLDHNIKCISLNKRACQLGLELFRAFVAEFSPKSNIRNTINDVLTLAIAIRSSGVLITKDSLLNRFASAYSRSDVQEKQGILYIQFSHPGRLAASHMAEGKGYVNRGWQVQVRRHFAID